jgi:hypothetical protein
MVDGGLRSRGHCGDADFGSRTGHSRQKNVKVDFKYDDGGIAKGGLVTLNLNDKKVGYGRVDKTEPLAASLLMKPSTQALTPPHPSAQTTNHPSHSPALSIRWRSI